MELGAERVAFSLDMMGGQLLGNGAWGDSSASVAETAVNGHLLPERREGPHPGGAPQRSCPYGACGGNPLIVELNPESGAARYGNWFENDLSF